MTVKIITLQLIVILILQSCNSDSPNNDTVVSSKKSNTSKSPESNITSERISFHPKEYKENIDDTLLDEKKELFLVINNYPIMDKGVDEVYEYEDGSSEKHHFRHQAAKIRVLRGDSIIFSSRITKESLPEIKLDSEFGRRSILQSVWFSDYADEMIILNCTLCVPDSDFCNFYKIYINNFKDQGIKLIEKS